MKKSTYKNKSNELKNKGITLIALVITIVLLIILAGVTISLLLTDNGLFKKAESTQKIQDLATLQERLELEKAPIQIENEGNVNLENYLEQIQEGEKPYTVDSVEKLNDTNAEIVVDEQYKFLVKDKQNGDVEIIYQGIARVEDLTIDPTSATYTYPTSGTFEVTNNKSGGKLSVKSNNDNIAKASIDGTTVTVTPGIVSGQTEIIVISEANGEYAENKVAHKAKVENGTIELRAEAYEGSYDGQEHDALENIYVNPSDAKRKYTLNGKEYEDIPKVSGASEYTVALEASKPGYMTNTITKTVTIGRQGNKEGNLTLSEASGILTYPEEKTFKVTNNASGGDLSVTSSNEAVATVKIDISQKPPVVTITPKAIDKDGQIATITVKSAATNNYEEQTVTYTATVNQGTISIEATPYTGTYDGQAHDAANNVKITPNGCKVTYSLNGATYSETMPKVTNAGSYTVAIQASKQGYITKTLTLTKTATVDKASGQLTLSATSGTLTYPNTITFDVTKNVSNGNLTVSSNNNNVATASIIGNRVTITPQAITEDNQKATITVKSESTENYNEKTATYTVTVNRGSISIEATPYTGTYDGQAHDAANNVKITPGGCKVTYSLNGATYSETMPKVTDAGSYTVAIQASKQGYITKTLTLTKTATVGQKNASGFTVDLSSTTFTYTGKQQAPTVTVKDGTKKLTSGKDYTVAFSDNINAGKVTVTVTGIGNYTGTKTANYTINRAGGSVNLSATSGTISVGQTTTFTASGTGTLSVSSSNTGVATASISGTTVTVKGIGAGSATITVTSAVATNYNSASKNYSITVKFDPNNLTIGSAINPNNYGKKVVGYSAGGISDWRLYYQDANYTYIISASVQRVGLIESFSRDAGYSPGNQYTISAIGLSLNQSNKTYLLANNNSCNYALGYLNDPNCWSEYKSGNALFAIGGPTLDLMFNSYTAVNPTSSMKIKPSTTNMGCQCVNPTSPIDTNVCNGLYNNGVDYWLATDGATQGSTMSVSGSAGKVMFTDTNNTNLVRFNRGFRPIVCLPTATFNYGLQ